MLIKKNQHLPWTHNFCSLIWRRRSTQSIVWLCIVTSHWIVCQRNSPHFSIIIFKYPKLISCLRWCFIQFFREKRCSSRLPSCSSSFQIFHRDEGDARCTLFFCLKKKLPDVEYTNDVVWLSEAEGFIDRLNDNVYMFGMRLAPSKCKILFQDWTGWKPNLVLTGDGFSDVNVFNYLSCCISFEDRTWVKMSSGIQKA